MLHGSTSGWIWPLVVSDHGTTATDAGVRITVMRLRTLTAIIVSVVCVAIFLAFRAYPMLRSYRGSRDSFLVIADDPRASEAGCVD